MSNKASKDANGVFATRGNNFEAQQRIVCDVAVILAYQLHKLSMALGEINQKAIETKDVNADDAYQSYRLNGAILHMWALKEVMFSFGEKLDVKDALFALNGAYLNRAGHFIDSNTDERISFSFEDLSKSLVVAFMNQEDPLAEYIESTFGNELFLENDCSVNMGAFEGILNQNELTTIIEVSDLGKLTDAMATLPDCYEMPQNVDVGLVGSVFNMANNTLASLLSFHDFDEKSLVHFMSQGVNIAYGEMRKLIDGYFSSGRVELNAYKNYDFSNNGRMYRPDGGVLNYCDLLVSEPRLVF